MKFNKIILPILLLPIFATAANVKMELTSPNGPYLCSSVKDSGCQNHNNMTSLTPPENNNYKTGDTFNVTCVFKPVVTGNKIKTNIGVIYNAEDISVSSNPEMTSPSSPNGMDTFSTAGKSSFSVKFSGRILDISPFFIADSISFYYSAENNIPESEKGDLLQVICKNT
ncbi:hypothetical protein OAO18_03340 [Francisellaceae bacterium]|nr:hypothetical protein [Francisellaceae bacterium]